MLRIAVVLFVTVAALTAWPATAASLSFENWTSGLSKWEPVTQNCTSLTNGTAVMTCQSAALRSYQSWDYRQSLSVEADVSGQPAPGSSTDDYWCGLVLWSQEDSKRQEYGSIELANDVPPPSANYSDRIGVLVASRSSWTNNASLQPYTRGATAKLRAVWSAVRREYTFFVGSTLVARKSGTPVRNFRVEIIAVSVGENTPNNGSNALCKFGPITVKTGSDV